MRATALTSPPRAAAIAILIALAINAPFALLEYATGVPNTPRSGFPVALFVGLFMLATLAELSGVAAARLALRGRIARYMLPALAAFVLAVTMAWAWLTLVTDQWPCFLGASGC